MSSKEFFKTVQLLFEFWTFWHWDNFLHVLTTGVPGWQSCSERQRGRVQHSQHGDPRRVHGDDQRWRSQRRRAGPDGGVNVVGVRTPEGDGDRCAAESTAGRCKSHTFTTKSTLYSTASLKSLHSNFLKSDFMKNAVKLNTTLSVLFQCTSDEDVCIKFSIINIFVLKSIENT